MNRRLIPLLAATVLFATRPPAAEERAREVPIGELSVVPLADLMPRNEHIDLHAKALAGARADTRLLHGADDSGDVALRGIAGLDGHYRPDETAAAHASAAIEGRRYREHRDLDGLGGEVLLDYRERGLVTSLGADASWIRTDELLLDTGERLVSDTWRGGAALERRQLFTHYGIAAEAARTDYRDGGALFGADDSDRLRVAADLHLAWDYAKEAFLFSHTRLEHLRYDRHTLYDDSVGVSQAFGWDRALGERSSFSVEAGVVVRRFLGRGDAGTDTRLAPFAELAVVLPWEEGSRLRGRVFSDLQDTATRAATWVYGTAWDVRYRLALATHLVAEAGVQQWRDSETPPGGERETRTVSEARVGAEHQLRAGWAFGVFGGWVDSSAEVGVSYHNFTAVAEVGFVY